MSDELDGRDPFRVFKVEPPSCLIFSVTIVKGYNITRGYLLGHSLFVSVGTLDPYVKLTIKTAPNGTQRTKHFNNDVNPEWNETFNFFLDPSVDNELEISLVVPNFLSDETISKKTIKISKEPKEKFHEQLQFSEKSAVDIEISSKPSDNLKQRYSHAPCDVEKRFIEERRKCVFQAMQDILGDDAPRTIKEVPTIGVLGSGGGFRALTASSGVMGALVESRISDMVIYNAGLSGSAWYLSTLYSHPDWPQKSPRELRNELRDSIGYSQWWKVIPPYGFWRYHWKRGNAKYDQGKSFRFTGRYGFNIGETLLQGRLDARLTDQREKLREGKIPLPMYAAVRVKTNVSAKVFHEWMEFNPYEIGILKYGIYIPAEMFGSKYFMGHLVKKCEEPPLHFLQGIWGSAYCLLLNRCYWKKGIKNSKQERDELDKELSNESLVQDSSSSDTRNSKGDGSHNSPTADSYDNVQRCSEVKLTSHDAYAGHEKKEKETNKSMGAQIYSALGSLLNYIPLWHTFETRAAAVYNFMRGLSVQSYTEQESKAICTEQEFEDFLGIEEGTENQFEEIFEKVPTSEKKLYSVDAGLAFNSPYPLLLRPQRGVDLVLSFEYSSRDQDENSLFSELLLAEEWAKLNKVPFPNIDTTIADREGLKECYVFENPDDPKCPIVMHFVILNIKFREYKAPGVPRRTKEEKDYANFDIFDDPKGTYSTFSFKYTNQAFDRLADLMEFNTLLWKEEIIENIKKCVKKRAN